MAVAQTNTERADQAAEDLAVKLKLEITFARELRSFFATLRSDLAQNRQGRQRNIPVAEYRPDLVAILRKNYRKVINHFGKQIRKQVEKRYGLYEIKQSENEQVDAALFDFYSRRAETQADFILQTTQSEFDGALSAVIAGAIVSGQLLNDEEITSMVNDQVRPRQNSRADTIATTEINSVAEKSKQIEFAALAAAGAVVGGKLLSESTVKRWDAVLDSRTRSAHAEADGQIRRTDEPYDVGGEQLMHPSDTSLGASLGNVINCRCSSQYVLE